MIRRVNTWPPEERDKAQGMLDATNGHTVLPYESEGGGLTTIWQEELTEWVDGRVGFEEVPESVWKAIGIDESDVETLRDAFGPTKVDMTEMPEIIHAE